MVSIIITALIAFISTNIDDILILTLFFTQTNAALKKRHIVIGQYLGIGILTVISIIGALGVVLIPQEYVGLLGLVPIYLGIKAIVDYRRAGSKKIETNEKMLFDQTAVIRKNRIIRFIESFVNPSVVKVSLVTIANGADNLGIYIPLFAGMSFGDIRVTVMIFMIMTGLWCLIAVKLAQHPFVQSTVKKYQHILVPLVFICLGIFILAKNRMISFL